MHSAERLCGSGDDLIVWHVAQVLSDVPAMPERVLKLAMPVTPEHLRERLTNLCARRHRLREHHFSVSDVKGQHHRRAANRGRGEYPHLRELIGDVQQTVANPQLDRHQPSIRDWDPADLLGPEGVAVESHSALGALNDNVGSDWHEPSLDCQHRELSNAIAAQHWIVGPAIGRAEADPPADPVAEPLSGTLFGSHDENYVVS
jgi:hypothetical protein